MDYALFIFTFTCVSILPGFCMSLAFSLGVSLGYKNTLWMMFGELFGLGLVVILCAWCASYILNYPMLFKVFKIFGAFFLFYIAFCLYKNKSVLRENKITHKEKISLIFQGFFASSSNPKAWIFILSILPSFIDENSNILFLTLIILVIEFCSLSLYAAGGSVFKIFLNHHLGKLNKISAFCVFILALSMIYESLT